MTEAPALLAIVDGIATITLNRPHKLNAFDAGMHAALRDVLVTIENDAALRAVILTGSGRAFCAGQDLSERAETLRSGDTPDLAASLEDNYNPLVRRLAALPVPVIVAVNGIAAGAGAALAIGCDIVIAARSARFVFSFAKVGLGPDSGASWLLPRLVGQSRALALALTAEPIDAEEAMQMGMVWKVCDAEALLDEALRIAATIANHPQAAVATIKRRLRAAAFSDFDDALDAERDAQAVLGGSLAYRDAVLRFARD